MATVTVDLGDSIPSLAKENGHFWRTVWDHPQNLQLKTKRKDPNVLSPGDEVFIPEIEVKEESRPTDQRHKFKFKGEAVKFKVRLLLMGEPRKNEPYVLDVDGKLINGTTDGDGQLEHVVPANAKAGRLILKGGAEEFPLRFGHLNPIDEVSGVQQRLNNLGFHCGSEDGEAGDAFKAAVSAFQARYNLPATGEVDGATRAKLEGLHP
jgi:N-acetylmuramoyl-L-alanine amidase